MAININNEPEVKDDNIKDKNQDCKAVLSSEPLLPNDMQVGEEGKLTEEEELAREDALLNKKLKKRIIIGVVVLLIGLAVFYFTVVRNHAKPANRPWEAESGTIR